MFGVVLFLVGSVIVGFTVFDFLKTAIGLAGLGPMTRWLTALLWRLARRSLPWLQHRVGRSFEDAVGPGMLCVVALAWIALNCLGYTLMYSAAGALEASQSAEPVGPVQRVAFAGSALSTLGGSLARPGNAWWDVLSMIAAVNGMIVLTLSVSFVMTVTQTTAAARALGLRTSALELRSAGMDDQTLAGALAALGSALAHVVVEMRSVPIVGYFTTDDQSLSFPRAVLRLCDMLERVDRPEAREAELPGLAELRLALRTLPEVEDRTAPPEQRPGLAETRRWAHDRIIGT